MPDARPKRILIVRVGAMGDILHALPAAHALRNAYPDVHLGWAVEPRWRPLLSKPLVDVIHEVPTQDWKAQPLSARTRRQILGLRRELQAQHYDLVVDLQGSIRSAVIARLSGASLIAGLDKPREWPARLLYGRRIRVRAASVIDQAAELLSAATSSSIAPQKVDFPRDAEADFRADREMSEAGVRDGFVLVSPSAGWGAKQWPAKLYRELVLQLQSSGHQVVLNGGSATDPLASKVAQGTDAPVISCGLAQFLALTRRAGLGIGGDTGPVHLAAALGVPTVALFGPTDPARNGPHFPGARTRILRHPESRLDHRRHPACEAGLARITVDEVLAAVAELRLNDARATP